MQVFELKGELRSDLGKKATAALRAQGKKFLAYFMEVRRMCILL